jgi:hypothetical protein
VLEVFFDDDIVSFILKYPHFYFKNDEQKIVIHTKSEHPDINYVGHLNSAKNKAHGEWEMTIYQKEHFDGYLKEVLTGSFEMQKIL